MPENYIVVEKFVGGMMTIAIDTDKPLKCACCENIINLEDLIDIEIEGLVGRIWCSSVCKSDDRPITSDENVIEGEIVLDHRMLSLPKD